MAYIKAADYQTAMHIADADLPENFDELAELAAVYIDAATGDYYQTHDIDADKWPLRVSQFKRANILQVRSMAASKVTSTDDLRKQPTAESQTIGKTAISKTYGNRAAAAGGLSVVVDDALHALGSVGLLYRGVMHR